MVERFDEGQFRANVQRGLDQARTVLLNEKRPVFASEVGHVYSDKYALAEYLVSTAASAQVVVLEALGVNSKSLRQLSGWAAERGVTLALRSTEKCAFNRETKREVESAAYKRDYGVGTITDKVVTTITEWFWDFTVEWSLVAYVGSDPSDQLVLQSRVGNYEVMTTSKNPPRKEVRILDPVEVNVTWLLSHIGSGLAWDFQIDRSAKACHTPRRNEQMDDALEYFDRFEKWCARVNAYFLSDLFPLQTSHGLSLGSLNADRVFIPVLPVFEKQSSNVSVDASESQSLVSVNPTTHVPSKVILSGSDNAKFIDEQKRSLAEKLSGIAQTFPDGGKLITVAEANVVVAAHTAIAVTIHLIYGVNYIEWMLRKQLIAAIGKEVTPLDFHQYMRWHNRQVFLEQYRPQTFAYAIRRPDYYPEGILSIEHDLNDGTPAEPIETFVSRHRIAPDTPMHFSISASAKVAFTGDVYLHGWVQHRFADEPAPRITLNARARQFSSFLVLIGRIAGPSLFDPQYGIIVQNKDEVMIPLLMETIPTPKEFRDAIESLSPEQQRFCKAFRAMQLSSTLFGVCVIQIKPQLEKLLKIPNESLTKEILLTQTLLDLFIQWQIPSDLLSFGGQSTASDAAKVSGVKGNVQAITDMIQAAKEKELEDKRKEAELKLMGELGSLNCWCQKAGHKMAPMISPYGVGKDWYCDLCKAKGTTTVCMHCAVCKYDFCLPCAKTQNGVPFRPPLPPPMPSPPGSYASYGAVPSAPPSFSSARFSSAGPAPAMPAMNMMMSAPPMAMSMSAPMPSPPPPAMSAPTPAPAPAPAPAPVVATASSTQPAAQPTQAPVEGKGPDANPSTQEPSKTQLPTPTPSSSALVDFTKIPTELDGKFEKLDEDAALRPTIIKVDKVWSRLKQEKLLAPLQQSTLAKAQVKLEKTTCYDLLDALTNSGAVSVNGASLHIIVASTHCFDKNIMNTLVQDNKNPIEKVERSELIVATTIHGAEASQLLVPSEVGRVAEFTAPAMINSNKV